MGEVEWLDKEEEAAWRGWLRMSDLLRARIVRDLAQMTGLSEADFAVLVWLSESGGQRLRMTDLAAGVDWSKSRLSHQVARMEARGLLRREGCPSDARGCYAVLTDRGRDEITRAAPHHLASVRSNFVDRLTRTQLRQLASIAARVVGHLEQSDSNACLEMAAGGPGSRVSSPG